MSRLKVEGIEKFFESIVNNSTSAHTVSAQILPALQQQTADSNVQDALSMFKSNIEGMTETLAYTTELTLQLKGANLPAQDALNLNMLFSSLNLLVRHYISLESYPDQKYSFVEAVAHRERLLDLHTLFYEKQSMFENSMLWWFYPDILQPIKEKVALHSSQSFRNNFNSMRELLLCFEVADMLDRAGYVAYASKSAIESLHTFLSHTQVFGSIFDLDNVYTLWSSSLDERFSKDKLLSLYASARNKVDTLVLCTCDNKLFSINGYFPVELLPWVSQSTLILPVPALKYLLRGRVQGVSEMLPFNLLNNLPLLYTAEQLASEGAFPISEGLKYAKKIG